MKKKLLLFTAFAGITSLALSSYSAGPSNGGAGNVSINGCNSNGTCHGGTSSNTSASLLLSDGASPVSKYTPGKEYTVTVAANNTASLPKFGFQATCVKSSATTTQAGTFATGGTTTVSTRSTTPQIIEHNTPIAGIVAGSYIVQFKWTAPAAGTGQVKFNLALNAVNGTGTSAGDQWTTATKTYDEQATGISTIANNLSLTAFPNPAINTLHVKVNGGKASNYKVAVYDLTGRMIQEQTINTQEATINTGALAAGTYVAAITSVEGRGIVSFVKQ